MPRPSALLGDPSHRTRWLPASLRALAEELGPGGGEACLRLMEAYGGVARLYIPRHIGPGHPIARIMGWPEATRLAAIYGGDYLCNVPLGTEAVRKARDAEIVERVAGGASPRDVALDLRITERTVRRVLAKARDAGPRQGSLFDDF